MLPEIEAFQKWLRRKAPNASTQIHYPNDLDLFFTWLDKPIGEVSVRDVDQFIEHCQRQGQAIASINRRLASLRAFYLFLAIEQDTSPKNPVLPRRHFICQGLRLPRDVQDGMLQKLFAVIDHPRDQAMFLLMLRCGLRVGEVRRLSLSDLYLVPAPGSLPRLLLHGKGSRERVAYLSHQPFTALREWLEIRPKVKCQAVFLNRFGDRLSVTGIQDRLAGYCQTAGIWITCHQLRHTFGRHLTEAHVQVSSIQRLLGHAHLTTTQIYLHLSDPHVQADYEAAMRAVSLRLEIAGEGGAG